MLADAGVQDEQNDERHEEEGDNDEDDVDHLPVLVHLRGARRLHAVCVEVEAVVVAGHEGDGNAGEEGHRPDAAENDATPAAAGDELGSKGLDDGQVAFEADGQDGQC